jgi:glyoxylase-like metal-dependent hydrolase (beta-lactamase superfamily II)
MRVVTLHPDVIVATSRVYQTTCIAIRSGDEGFVIDSPIFPDELDVLPALLEQAGFGFSGLLATHGDWDHLLGRLAFPDAALGCAETTAARLTGEPGAAQRTLRAFDEEHYVERPRPLSLGQVQALPVPGRVEIGAQELELHPADGHTADGMAVWAPWAGVLACGDYLSPVEIPMLSPGGSRDAYLATLERLRPLVQRADWVVPGHGAPLDGGRAAAILEEDVTYLTDWTLPLARRTAEQRRIHESNMEVGRSPTDLERPEADRRHQSAGRDAPRRRP